MKAHLYSILAAGLTIAPGTLSAQTLQNADISVNIAGAAHTFSYRGTTTAVSDPNTVTSDRKWGWDGTFVSPATTNVAGGASNYPEYPSNRVGAAHRPPSIRFSIPAGTTKIKIDGTLTTPFVYAPESVNNTQRRANWWAGSWFAYWGPESMPDSSTTGVGVINPFWVIKAADGSWTRTQTTSETVLSAGTFSKFASAQTVPANAKTFTMTGEAAVPAGFSGNVDLTLSGFLGCFNDYRQTSGWLRCYGTYHIPTTGSLVVTVEGQPLTGTLTAPSGKLMEGYKGSIPIQFSVQ